MPLADRDVERARHQPASSGVRVWDEDISGSTEHTLAKQK